MVSRLENLKFLNYNNGLRSGGEGGSSVIIYSSPSIRKKSRKCGHPNSGLSNGFDISKGRWKEARCILKIF